MDWIGLIAAVLSVLFWWHESAQRKKADKELREQIDLEARDRHRIMASVESIEKRDALRHEAETTTRVAVRAGLAHGGIPLFGADPRALSFTIVNRSAARVQVQKFRVRRQDGAAVWAMDFLHVSDPRYIEPRSSMPVKVGGLVPDLLTMTAWVKLSTTELIQVELELEDDVRRWLEQQGGA